MGTAISHDHRPWLLKRSTDRDARIERTENRHSDHQR